MSTPISARDKENDVGSEEAATFAISSVAKLTGISEHCLRIWERRYAVVEPSRTDTKRRRYSKKDVERLVLIKYLLDAGDTISSVAPLSLEQLQERSKSYPGRKGIDHATDQRPVRLAIIGERLPAQVDNARMGKEGLHVAALYHTSKELLESPPDAKVDAVVFDLGSFHLHAVAEMEKALRASGAQRGILVYGFATRQALEALNREHFVALRAPVDLHEIRIACADPHMVASTHETDSKVEKPEFIPHRYNVNELAQFASSSTKINCECPHHLVSLIFGLNAFEKYSLECESLNPDDAELHRYLYNMTSKSRAIVEEALAKIARAEGIVVKR